MNRENIFNIRYGDFLHYPVQKQLLIDRTEKPAHLHRHHNRRRRHATDSGCAHKVHASKTSRRSLVNLGSLHSCYERQMDSRLHLEARSHHQSVDHDRIRQHCLAYQHYEAYQRRLASGHFHSLEEPYLGLRNHLEADHIHQDLGLPLEIGGWTGKPTWD